MNNSSINDLPMCSSAVATILTSAISFVSFAAFVGNSLVTLTFLINSTLRTSTNYFIVNMAISDLMSSLTNLPLAATERFLSKEHNINGTVATFVCKLGMYSRAVSQMVSVQSLLLIVVDRYIAIVLPMKAIHVPKRLRAALLLFTWLFSLLIGIPYIQATKIVRDGSHTLCRFSWTERNRSVFHSVLFLIFYCLPVVSIVILYSRIMNKLRQERPGEREQENTRTRNLRQNRIVMRVFVWIVSTFFIFWTPLCVYVVLKVAFPTLVANDPCMLYTGLFFYVFPALNTVFNPVILFSSSSRFSEALKGKLICLRCKLTRCCRGEGRVLPQSGKDVSLRVVGYD